MGVIVAVGSGVSVGGTGVAVGVSVGGIGVSVGSGAAVGGTGVLVGNVGDEAAHPASISIATAITVRKNLGFISTSFCSTLKIVP